jgi:hypothetical protein
LSGKSFQVSLRRGDLFAALLLVAFVPVMLGQATRVQDFTMTTYSTSRTTLSTISSTTVVSTDFVILPAFLNQQCSISYKTFYGVKAGQRFVGDVTIKPATLPLVKIEMYVFNSSEFDNSYATAQSKPDCYMSGSLLNVTVVDKYHIDFTFPRDGDYFLVLVDASNIKSVGVAIRGTEFLSYTVVSTTVETSEIIISDVGRFFIPLVVGTTLAVALLIIGQKLTSRRRHRSI